MQNNKHIPDDLFIPEGLEFREEYLQSAMQMYQRERRKALWFKRFVFVCVVVLLVTGVFVWTSQNQSAVHEQSAISNSYQKDDLVSSSEKKSLQEESSLNKKDKSGTPLNIQEVSEQRTRNKTIATNEKLSSQITSKRNALSAEANDHGGSLSSGSGLPDQQPQGIAQVGNPTDSSVSKPSTHSVQETTDEPILSSTSDSNAAINAENSLETTIPIVIYKKINYRTPSYFETSTTSGIAASNPIKTSAVNNFKPYLIVGIIPITDFGLKYSRFKLNPYIALGVDKRLGNGWKTAVDARYYFVSGLSHPLTFEQTTYGLGFETNSTTIYTNRLHYAGLNVALQKKIKSHQFTLGYGIDYLITGQNEIEESITSTFAEVTSKSNASTKGYVLGFRNFNHSFSLGYDYWLGRNKALGFSYQYGLTDISRNEYFKDATINRNSMLTVRLKMYLR